MDNQEIHPEIAKLEQISKEIAAILNKYSVENKSNTPDYMLADYMLGCLNVYENTIRNRNQWYGTKQEIK